MKLLLHLFPRTVCVVMLWLQVGSAAEDLTAWQTSSEKSKPIAVTHDTATLQSVPWTYLVSPEEHANFSVSAKVTINSPANHFGFFGSSWSVWPDATFGDGGFEASLLLRADEKIGRGYRVQVSHRYQEIALVRFPDGGYVRSVPCVLKTQHPFQLQVTASGGVIQVSIDGKELIHYIDPLEPAITAGRVGVGVSSAANVTFASVDVKKVSLAATTAAQEHQVQFKSRRWIGGRDWIFDGDEPILLLPSAESSYINNVKLRPGYKPQLSWNSHWDTQNQGAYKEAENHTVDVRTTGGGETLVATWRGKHVADRFGTKTRMTVGFDRQRGTYQFDIESELEVFPGEPFHFRYGYDFEHHTPLDPFRWQYLIARKRGGELYHRPVYPIDPGPQNDIEMYHGKRVWYGRHNGDMQIAPAVEYEIDPKWNEQVLAEGKTRIRQCNTAVCAAFYDTGVSFAPETAKPGTKVRVKYRYTGYPAAEAEELFKASAIYSSPTLDPNHHYIFADEWPKLTFSQFAPMSRTWQYGQTPFQTAHNQRPTYELEKNCGAGSGFAMKLGPASYGKATLSKSGSLPSGRYVVTALVKSINAFGPGGRIEIEATQAKSKKTIATVKHFVGNGSFDWQKQGFVFDLPDEAAAFSIAFGNAGTGTMLVTDVEFHLLDDNQSVPVGVATKPNDVAPAFGNAPVGAIADYRMEEGQGLFVMNHASSSMGHLNLANIDWVRDTGRAALRFAENTSEHKKYRADSGFRFYFGQPGYEGKESLPIALTGHHGGGSALNGLTMAAWIKPDEAMGQSLHPGKGDVIGFGARRFILGLHGQTSPYKLAARINVNDVIESAPQIEANRWSHIAMTAEPIEDRWRVQIYLDGKPVGDGLAKFSPKQSVPSSLILGAEIFYFHSSYYRGLIGRTLVFNRTLSVDEIAKLAKE